MSDVLAAEEIDPGHHITAELFGLTFNLDTIWTTALAGAIVVIFGLVIARKASSGVPTKPQLMWEALVGAIEDQVEDALGKRTAPFVVPLAVTLFAFILIANWVEVIPSQHTLVPPTADVNLTFAMAFFVIGWVHIFGVRKQGAHYFKHFFQPWFLTPINIIEEIAKPITLSLRLFGNIFSGGIMLAVIGLMPYFVLWLPNGLWKLFGMAVGVIQAFIFALLTILYFSFAAGGREEEKAAH